MDSQGRCFFSSWVPGERWASPWSPWMKDNFLFSPHCNSDHRPSRTVSLPTPCFTGSETLSLVLAGSMSARWGWCPPSGSAPPPQVLTLMFCSLSVSALNKIPVFCHLCLRWSLWGNRRSKPEQNHHPERESGLGGPIPGAEGGEPGWQGFGEFWSCTTTMWKACK